MLEICKKHDYWLSCSAAFVCDWMIFGLFGQIFQGVLLHEKNNVIWKQGTHWWTRLSGYQTSNELHLVGWGKCFLGHHLFITIHLSTWVFNVISWWELIWYLFLDQPSVLNPEHHCPSSQMGPSYSVFVILLHTGSHGENNWRVAILKSAHLYKIKK